MSIAEVCVNAEKWFRKIAPHKTNSEIVWDTIGIDTLAKFVVKRLSIVETEDKPFWWQDKELFRTFERGYSSGIIMLPMDVVERVRWIALMCVAICQKEGFSYGNVLIPPYYIPDEELYQFDHYGASVLEEVQKFRRDVAEHGWKSLIT
jgi:hypothetical protein